MEPSSLYSTWPEVQVKNLDLRWASKGKGGGQSLCSEPLTYGI